MNKEKLDNIKKNVGEIKDRAEKMSQDAMKTASTVKGAIETGVQQSKKVINKAIQKESLGQGIEVTSKGMEFVAKGAKIAAVGAEKLARGMEKGSEKMRHFSEKLRGKSGT